MNEKEFNDEIELARDILDEIIEETENDKDPSPDTPAQKSHKAPQNGSSTPVKKIRP